MYPTRSQHNFTQTPQQQPYLAGSKMVQRRHTHCASSFSFFFREYNNTVWLLLLQFCTYKKKK